MWNTGATVSSATTITACATGSYCNYVKCSGNDKDANELTHNFTNCGTVKNTIEEIETQVKLSCKDIAFKRKY